MVKSKRVAFIVTGLGYGDEGKGLTTDYLCKKYKNAIVIRFNGGHQAGHTVVKKNGIRHVFSSFGAGTLRNIPTYWSKYCTFCPSRFIDEYYKLKKKPKFYIDSKCPITTHYDILYNRAIETTRGKKRYGSCGLGFGATIERQKILPITINDFLNQKLALKKLKQIKDYYRKRINSETKFDFNDFGNDFEDNKFIQYIRFIQNLIKTGEFTVCTEKWIFNKNNSWKTYIFEGAQGILLDQNFGQSPYITKSNTTSQNAIDILKRNSLTEFETQIFYVTRAYLTRHGNGPFKRKPKNFSLINNHAESNEYNEFQGALRYSYLNIDLINYAILCDNKFSSSFKKNLVITCVDQIKSDQITFTFRKNEKNDSVTNLTKYINCQFETVLHSKGNFAEQIKVIKNHTRIANS